MCRNLGDSHVEFNGATVIKKVCDLKIGDRFWFSGTWRVIVKKEKIWFCYTKAYKKGPEEKLSIHSLMTVKTQSAK
jgi:hypothetical protein